MINNSRGQSLIEVVIAVSIFLMIASATVITVLGSLTSSRLAADESRAASLAKEGLEAVESIRNRNWSAVADGSYGLSNISGTWELTGSSESQGKFTRVISIDPILRNENGHVVLSGGTEDPNSKKITSTITWNFVPSKLTTVEMTKILTNWQEVSKEVAAVTPSPTPTGGPTNSPTNTPTNTPTSSPTNTPANTSTPTPTTSVNSCTAFCASLGYSSGICRRNANQCTSNGEVAQPGGNIYCISNPNTDCCCRP